MQIQNRCVNVVQQLRVIFDGIAAGEEDDDLLLKVFFEEGEEEEEAAVGGADDVALRERRDGACALGLVDVDVERAGAKGYSREVGDLRGLRCREEHGLAVFWRSWTYETVVSHVAECDERTVGQNVDNLLHLLLESDLQYAVRLVNDETLQILEHKPACVL